MKIIMSDESGEWAANFKDGKTHDNNGVRIIEMLEVSLPAADLENDWENLREAIIAYANNNL